MEYDIAIIGAGIHGAGIAQAAAAAGYTALIIEQYEEPGLGTSSRSSKLIHGGLRYLETGQISLVRECLRERSLLINNAPHLVTLVPFYIPVYEETHRDSMTITAGLILYTLLGGKGFCRIPKSKWNQLDGLKTEGLKAVFQYWDAQTDDKALTEAVLKSAVQLGAVVKLGCKLQRATTTTDGCCIEYVQNQQTGIASSKVLINASGPWINTTLRRIFPTPRQLEIDLVQGAHILLPANPGNGVYYLEAPQDQRAVLVMPWQGATLIGTTEQPFHGDPSDVKPSDEEIAYLLEVYRHYFHSSLNKTAVKDSFAGIRVLKHDGNSLFHRSRETILHIDKETNPMVLSIYGGKLSSYRATGEKVIKKIAGLLPKRIAISDTKELKLPHPTSEI